MAARNAKAARKSAAKAPAKSTSTARRRKSGGRAVASATPAAPDPPLIVYIHGIGEKPPKDALKRQWDLALFGRDMGERTRMAYWADILHGDSGGAGKASRAISASTIDADALLDETGISARRKPQAAELVDALLTAAGVPVAAAGKGTRVLPLPAFLRKPIARKFLEWLVKDSAAYFFKDDIRRRIRQRFLDAVAGGGPVVVVSHSQGTVVSLEVIAELAKGANPLQVEHYVTLGSPLGLREVQDFLDCKLEVPAGIERWNNFADPLDPVALDKGLGGDFGARDFIVDELILNTELRRMEGLNAHSAVGYLAHPKVRRVVQESARVDMHARFLMARDVAAELAVERRQPVLIEILEPGYRAIGESRDDMLACERKAGPGHTDLRTRIGAAAQMIRGVVERHAASASAHEGALAAARIDPLKRFVAAHLTPSELGDIAARHRELRVYAIWKSTRKTRLVHRSARVVQVDAARASYGAQGERIRWAVLDTGVHCDHPHFATHRNLVEVWDCTRPGPPTRIDTATPGETAARRRERETMRQDRDGHGTHVAGIIAGVAPAQAAGHADLPSGLAPRAQLVVYKVLDDRGRGEDAWIIKALDHITEQNENASSSLVDGVNLSLGGPYDSTVYGCGFTPICAELRRLWRAGVLVVVAAGNEGQTQVSTPDGELDLNTSLSIGDPANLEDCIAVGSVNADKPHLYGISAFSSRGPTSDGRAKPDVVAPGERIRSCASRFRAQTLEELYREESGTSMAAPHVSGLLAAFLSVRGEFRGRPDEVKALLLRTCIDLGRDRYHQGAGLPNLMRMLLEA